MIKYFKQTKKLGLVLTELKLDVQLVIFKILTFGINLVKKKYKIISFLPKIIE